MRIKSYFAKSVDEAMVQARAELGNDALLLNTRKNEGGKPENYEVVFGTAEAVTPLPLPEIKLPPAAKAERGNTMPERQIARPAAESLPLHEVPSKAEEPQIARPETSAERRHAQPERRTAKPESPRPPVAAPNELAGELERLHSQMDEIRALIVRSASSRVTAGRSVPELADVYARLMGSEVDPALSKDIVDRLEAVMATDAFFLKGQQGQENIANRWKSLRFDPVRLTTFVRAELERRVRVAPQLGAVAVLVGPTGAGKTTTMMKLAASDVVAGRAMRLLSLDNARAASQAQLQSFASNLGIAFASVPSIHALPGLLAEAGKKKELVLIDTPGYAGNDPRSAEVAAAVLLRCASADVPVDVHVVAPGYMKGADLRRCLQRYQIFRPSKLLVTKLDETQSLGSAFSEAAYARLAMSFLTNGPSVPEDIRAVSIEDLLGMALDRSLALDRTGARADGAGVKAQCA
jgi:flagellar biosynthesis protein FlhF